MFWRGGAICISESESEKAVTSFVFLKYDRYRLLPKIPRNNVLTLKKKPSWGYTLCQNECRPIPDMIEYLMFRP